MRFLKFIILLLPFIILSSCKPKNANTYYPNGNIRLEFKKLPNNRGYIKSHYNEDGSKHYEIYFNKDSLRNGMATFYYENGNVESKVNFVNGKENGLFQSYFENGNKKMVVHLVRGAKEGILKQYFATGELRALQECLGGKITGEATFYHKNGNLNQKQLLINGRLLTVTFFDSLQNGVETQTDIKIFPINLKVLLNDNDTYKLHKDADLSGCKLSAEFYAVDGHPISGDSIAKINNGKIVYPLITTKLGVHELKGTAEVDSANVKVRFPLTVKYHVVKQSEL